MLCDTAPLEPSNLLNLTKPEANAATDLGAADLQLRYRRKVDFPAGIADEAADTGERSADS